MGAGSRPVVVRVGSEVRGTQSFVQVMAAVWRRPSLTAIEIAWRWCFGVVALWLLGTNARHIWMTATGGTGDSAVLGIDHLPVTDPMAASVQVGEAMVKLWPPTLLIARWLVPLLCLLWVIVSAIGRAALMRRMDRTLCPRVATLVVLGAVRLVFLGAATGLWFWGLVWAGSFSITSPAATGGEPNLVLYFAIVIGLTLLLFLVWAAVSWALSIAPMLSMIRGTSSMQSLRASFRLGPLRGKLVEINLVMGIVKVALVVLAMVFSASPLPFQSVASDGFLYTWWAGVTLMYLLASDYFHVVRAAAYLALWRTYDEASASAREDFPTSPVNLAS